MNRKGRAKSSSLFLFELILAILFFAIASAVCVQIFVKSHLLSEDASQLNHAVNVASSAAQVVGNAKSMDEVNTSLTSVLGDDSHIYYDKNWNVCERSDAVYRMAILLEADETMVTGTITISDLTDNSEIYALDVAHHLQNSVDAVGSSSSMTKGGIVDV